AQLEHLLPRLAGGWSHLERQRGGVGLRGGPGETQIEVDRRLIRQRLKRLRQRLSVIERQRQTRRTARTDVPLATCALVGYTNAGKSTLLNKLTNSEVYADNRLFATLDPTSRLLSLASARRVILTDTVGFIQNLPTELVEAFAATLEEVRAARMLAAIVDASHPDADAPLTTGPPAPPHHGVRPARHPGSQQGGSPRPCRARGRDRAPGRHRRDAAGGG